MIAYASCSGIPTRELKMQVAFVYQYNGTLQ